MSPSVAPAEFVDALETALVGFLHTVRSWSGALDLVSIACEQLGCAFEFQTKIIAMKRSSSLTCLSQAKARIMQKNLCPAVRKTGVTQLSLLKVHDVHIPNQGEMRLFLKMPLD